MQYIKNIKEMLKDPKKKSLAQLSLYGIFFIFTFVVLNGAKTPPPVTTIKEEKPSLQYYSDMSGYNYKVTYTNINKVDVIEGSYYDKKSIFSFNNIKYYYEDFLYIIDNDSYYLGNIEYNISKIFSNNFANIIKQLEEESKTIYKDGTIITNYTIDSNKIYNYLFESESVYTNLVNVAVIEKENKIHNIIIDLSHLGLNLTKIETEYTYLNEITSLSFNKDNYTYKESL